MSDVVEDVVHGIFEHLRSIRHLRQAQSGCLLIFVMSNGVLMALMMFVATLEKDVQVAAIKSKEPAPYWVLIFLLWMCMILMSLVFGVLFRNENIMHSVRGSLEYTTIMIFNMKKGYRYAYAYDPAPSDENKDDAAEKWRREVHQLKVEAGLAGWTEEMLQEQISRLREAYGAKEDLEHAQKEAETNVTITGGDNVECQKSSVYNLEERAEVVKAEVAKLFSMGKHTIGAMPPYLGILCVFFAIATLGIGAMGSMLTIKMADMPDPDDNPLWMERCWQMINVIFVVVAIWKGPQRVVLMYHWLRKDWVHEIDGVSRSLLMPGVLLSHVQVGYVAWLRVANILCQYIVCFFMWAWLPRCLQEQKEQKKDCTSRPAWGIPVFLVLGILTDVSSNVLLSMLIAACPYTKWPIEAAEGPTLRKGVEDGPTFPKDAWIQDSPSNMSKEALR
jgi:hypothetical protein